LDDPIPECISTQTSEETIKVLVIGCGSIGRRHIANLNALGVSDISVVDPDEGRLEEVQARFKTRSWRTLGEALRAEPQAALICTPPHIHVALALEAVRAGCHCLIEKPISDRMEGLEALFDEAGSRGLKIAVGYNLRFHPGLVRLKELLALGGIGRAICVRAEVGTYLPQWRPWQDYRQSYTAKRKMGGGVILDLSHELDLARCLMGEVEQVFCVAGSLGPLDLDVEDTAEIILRFRSGAIGSVHLNMIQRTYSRSCKVVGTEGIVTWDLAEGILKCFSAKTGEWQAFQDDENLSHTYTAELKHFLHCISSTEEPIVTAMDGKQALKMALAAKQSAEIGQAVRIPGD